MCRAIAELFVCFLLLSFYSRVCFGFAVLQSRCGLRTVRRSIARLSSAPPRHGQGLVLFFASPSAWLAASKTALLKKVAWTSGSADGISLIFLSSCSVYCAQSLQFPSELAHWLFGRRKSGFTENWIYS